MNYRKHGLRALGLSFLAALSLLAFAASGAQAAGLFLVLETPGGNNYPHNWSAEISGTAVDPLNHKLLILGLNMEIFCHSATVSGLITELGHGHVKAVFASCLAQGVSGGALTGAVCTIPDITATALATVILHSGGAKLTLDGSGTGTEHKTPTTGNPYILLSPLDGLTFAKVLNHTECALPEIANVKGCVVAEFLNPSQHLVKHKLSTLNMLELFGCELKYGTNGAHLDAEVEVQLINGGVGHGQFAGKEWGAV